MEFRISINEKAVFALLIVIAMVSAVGITLAQTNNPGHFWSQIDCPSTGCITSANIMDGQVRTADIAGNAVTTAKIADGQVQTADIGDGQVTNAKIGTQAVDQTKIEDGSLLIGFGMRTDVERSASGTTPTTFTSGMVYIPDNAQKVQLIARLRCGTLNRVSYIRLKVGSLTSAGTSRADTTYAWVTDSPLDVSSLSGWQLFEVQAWNNVQVTAYIQGFSLVWRN